ncbi:MAG: hypothetical protein ACKOXO_10650 [Cyanobium sp.]
MAADPLESLHLALMQEVLPVGLAMVDRVRRGGPREVIAAFESDAADPLSRLRQEGEPAARQVREGLDQLQPGLGNPVMHVSVRDVPSSEAAPSPTATEPRDNAASGADHRDPAELQRVLARIQQRLDLLEQRLVGAAPSVSGPGGGRG